MKDYKEFTFGWIIFIFLIPMYLLIIYLYVTGIGDSPIDGKGVVVLTVLFTLIVLLFYGLTTKLSQDTITISFGVGLIRKVIQLRHVKAVARVKSPWYYGFGIRVIPNGILYNISGWDGVELRFNDSDRIIRIGTKDSVLLEREILNRLEIKGRLAR